MHCLQGRKGRRAARQAALAERKESREGFTTSRGAGRPDRPAHLGSFAGPGLAGLACQREASQSRPAFRCQVGGWASFLPPLSHGVLEIGPFARVGAAVGRPIRAATAGVAAGE